MRALWTVARTFAVSALAIACAGLKSADDSADAGSRDSDTASTSSSNGSSGAASSGASSSGASSSGASSSGASSGGGDASGGSSGASSSGGPTGPGPYGALPSGYCCTRDEDCRNRHCVAFDTQKICVDDCRRHETCANGSIRFTCDSPNGFVDGRCQPPPNFTCVPAASFARGTKPRGACCSPTGDGNAGLECEGGLCIALGPSTNPFVCSNACSGPADCSGPFICAATVAARRECVPANTTYTCQ